MLSVKSTLSSFFNFRQVWKGTTSFAHQKTYLFFCSLQKPTDFDPIRDNLQSDMDEDEIEKKRFKAHLPENVYKTFIRKEFIPPVNKEHFRKQNLRKLYGKFGEESGLNPGIAWPTREELLEIIEHDKMFHPPLKEMLDRVSAEEQEKMEQRLAYEAEVDKNFVKLETEMKKYYAEIAKNENDAKVKKLKQQLLITEISELLGYDVDPKDPKFEEAVKMRQKEEKKARKVRKQQESYERMIVKLRTMSSSNKMAETGNVAKEEHEKPEVIHGSKET